MTFIQSVVGIYFLLSDPGELTFVMSFPLLIFSSLLTFFFFLTFEILLSKHNLLTGVVHFIGVLFYAIFWGFELHTKDTLGFALIKENFFQIFEAKALSMIIDMVGVFTLSAAIFIILSFLITDIFLLRKREIKFFEKKIILTSMVTYVFCSILFSTIDPFDYFFKDSLVFLKISWKIDEIKTPVKFPYLKAEESKIPPLEEQPHIFLLQIESFNKNFVETQSPEGIVYTPFYNSLIKNGFYVDKFYGPSIQTARGQFMIHCGIPESFMGKSFTQYGMHNFHCLPEILKDAGFTTVYFHNFWHGDFDNGAPFMSKNGFQIVKAMNNEFVHPPDYKDIWGWGLQDDKFYIKFFNYMDSIEYKSPRKRRYFSSLLTVSSHMMFNGVPLKQRYIYKYPKNTKEDYSNAIRVTDEYLRTFMAEIQARPYLKNSIIIITGDHSYPIGEHGNYSNAVGFYEESFRTPFLMIWQDHIAPRRENNIAYSQLDIAPTLLKLLNLEVSNHFSGVSMFDSTNTQHEIPLIQPYGGIYVGNVVYPFKYIKHLKSNKEFVFNLDEDPKEEINLAESANSIIEKGNASVQELFLNQALLERNQIWPSSKGFAKDVPTDTPDFMVQ